SSRRWRRRVAGIAASVTGVFRLLAGGALAGTAHAAPRPQLLQRSRRATRARRRADGRGMPAGRSRQPGRHDMAVSAAKTTAGRILGSAIKRREDPRLMMGAGTFVDDLRVAGMV